MISEGSFNISFTNSIEFLKKLKLFKSKGVKNIGVYSDEFLKICRTNRHTSIYKVAIDNLDYELLLFDDSIIQISKTSNSLRYCFIQNPNNNITKFDFLRKIYSDEELDEFDDETLKLLELEISEIEFEQYLNEQELNLNSTIIRYDYDVKGYKPLIHSCSHLHIGLNENFRIPCSIILTPLKFLIFCIKQVYFERWTDALEKDISINYIGEAKSRCKKIRANWVSLEEKELYIQ